MSKIYFQGTYGAYSHLAALSIEPKSEIFPCKTFDECFLKASKDSNSKIIIPESNRITGNIGIEYLIFKYRLNIYAEHFFPINHSLLGVKESKLNDIKDDLTKQIEQKIFEIENSEINEKLKNEKVDITLPFRPYQQGKIHPVSQVIDEISSIFSEIGFSVAEGPDVESEYNNFTALNTP